MTDLEERPVFTPRGAETWRDVHGSYARLRDHDPVHHVGDGDYWVLSRFGDVFNAARDTTTFSSAQGLTFNYGDREKSGLDASPPIVMMDPPEHTAFRRLVSKAFTPRNVVGLEPEIRAFVVERIERLRAAGEGDVVTGVFKPLPSFVVARFLGVPEGDRSRFDGWTEAIVAGSAQASPVSPLGCCTVCTSSRVVQIRAVPKSDSQASDFAIGPDRALTVLDVKPTNWNCFSA